MTSADERRLDHDRVLHILQRAGIDAALIDTLLTTLSFPVSLADLHVELGRHGITRDGLESRLGGSP